MGKNDTNVVIFRKQDKEYKDKQVESYKIIISPNHWKGFLLILTVTGNSRTLTHPERLIGYTRKEDGDRSRVTDN